MMPESKAEIYIKSQQTVEKTTIIKDADVKKIIEQINLQFNIDVLELAKKIVLNKFNNFSISKYTPYTQLYVSGVMGDILINLMTLDKELKLTIKKEDVLHEK